MGKKLAAVLTLALFLATPVAVARERDQRDRERREPRLVKLVKKLFGIESTSDHPVIPRP